MRAPAAPKSLPPVPEPDLVIDEMRSVVADLHPKLADKMRINLDSALDRDLGLDSLARMELMARMERRWQLRLTEASFAHAESVRDIWLALRDAAARRGAEPGTGPDTESDRGPGAGPSLDTAPRPAATKAGSGEGEPPGYSGAEEEVAPLAARNLLEVLAWHTEHHPSRVHVQLYDDDHKPHPLTYGELDRGARSIAGGLAARGVGSADTVAIMLPTSSDYLASFLGILMVGAIPVPIYPPARAAQIEDHFTRHARILDNAQARLMITFGQAKQVARLLGAQVSVLREVVTVDELRCGEPYYGLPNLGPEVTALLQYTSGSTGNPKGVILTHSDLMSSLRCMGEALEVTPRDVFVSWLPLYHDMGLIGAWLGALVYGFTLVLMSPLAFLGRPERWLRAIHDHGGTMSGGPNFAYELCVGRIAEGALVGLDLSSWRIAFNGAEPVSPTTLSRFVDRYQPYGLDPCALMPVYGLAEATLGVAFTPVGRGPVVESIDAHRLAKASRAEPLTPKVVPKSAPQSERALALVSAGIPIPGFELRVVDETGVEASERQVGQVQFKGPSATRGYYRNPEATKALFQGDWVQSGDEGYIAGGELFITGRVKDVIIRAGRNIYPYELEDRVAEVEGVRRGCVAAFGATDRAAGTEKLVVVAETRATDPEQRARMQSEIETLALELLGLPADEVVIAGPNTVLKTSSGKIRRSAVRDLYEQGRLQVPGRWVGWQLLRLAFSAVLPQWRRWWRGVGHWAYAAYAWGVFLAAAVMTWFAIGLTPGLERRWRVMRVVGRTVLWLCGLRLRVTGAQSLPPDAAPFVLVANHASYLDGLLLVVALPRPVRFVAKSELTGHFITRIFLARLGCLFVERFDRERSTRDAEAVAKALGTGDALAIFPEGSFHRTPGLMPFHMGAFLIAAENGAEVVPATIVGARYALRAEILLPRRANLSVHFSHPISEEGAGVQDSVWERAVRLRDRARAELLRHCREPDLAHFRDVSWQARRVDGDR